MVAYADTGFVVSLYLQENTSSRASKIVQRLIDPLPVTPLLMMEFRNALNLAIKRGRIDVSGRDALWRAFENDIAKGLLTHASFSNQDVYRSAMRLSDRYAVQFGTRSLDLLHVATALVLETKELFTFDERQAKTARAAGLEVRP